MTRANLAIVTKGLDELCGARRRGSRPSATARDAIAFPPQLLRAHDEPDVAALIDGETQAVRAARAAARAGQKAQLRERIAQLNEEISGLTRPGEAKDQEIELISKELEGVRELCEQEPGADHRA